MISVFPEIWAESEVPASVFIEAFESLIETRVHFLDDGFRLSKFNFEAKKLIAGYRQKKSEKAKLLYCEADFISILPSSTLFEIKSNFSSPEAAIGYTNASIDKYLNRKKSSSEKPLSLRSQ